MVLVTTTLGYVLGGRGVQSIAKLIFLLCGTAFVCAGAAALNHYLERDVDGLMLRTRNRPIPSGKILPLQALLFGIVLVLCGVLLLWWQINLLCAFLSLLTAFLYALVYTPMKRMSWLNTSIGAIPGALPPVGGWVAATGDISLGAVVLFLILFAWQHPHFYSIAWMLKEDYQRAGFKMLPVVHPDGKSTCWQIVLFSFVLIPISLSLTWLGISGPLYFWGALFLGGYFLFQGFLLFFSKSLEDAHEVLKTSVFYLPILLILLCVDIRFIK